MTKYINPRLHDVKGFPTEYSNRVDLDTTLKERGLGTKLYPNGSEERKDIHKFLIRRAERVGKRQAINEVRDGKMFDKKDLGKL